MSLTCLRPIPKTGPSALWTKAGRDTARLKDAARCNCGQPYCRDREVTGKLDAA